MAPRALPRDCVSALELALRPTFIATGVDQVGCRCASDPGTNHPVYLVKSRPLAPREVSRLRTERGR